MVDAKSRFCKCFVMLISGHLIIFQPSNLVVGYPLSVKHLLLVLLPFDLSSFHPPSVSQISYCQQLWSVCLHVKLQAKMNPLDMDFLCHQVSLFIPPTNYVVIFNFAQPISHKILTQVVLISSCGLAFVNHAPCIPISAVHLKDSELCIPPCSDLRQSLNKNKIFALYSWLVIVGKVLPKGVLEHLAC